VIFDIPSDVHELMSGAGNPETNLAPAEAIQSLTDYGKPGYGGPCPPEGHGFHQYVITVYALKTEKLGLDENSLPGFVGFNLWGQTIEKASIVMYFKR
jgi:Raf kinase inhibitor-like YbhB/YbcL family protein